MTEAAEQSNPIEVLKVEGRYPFHPRPLHWRNLQAKVSRSTADVCHIRIDDQANPEAWFIVTIQFCEDGESTVENR